MLDIFLDYQAFGIEIFLSFSHTISGKLHTVFNFNIRSLCLYKACYLINLLFKK